MINQCNHHEKLLLKNVFSSSREELGKINVLQFLFQFDFCWEESRKMIFWETLLLNIFGGGTEQIKKKCTIIIHGQATTEIISIDHHLTCV